MATENRPPRRPRLACIYKVGGQAEIAFKIVTMMPHAILIPYMPVALFHLRCCIRRDFPGLWGFPPLRPPFPRLSNTERSPASSSFRLNFFLLPPYPYFSFLLSRVIFPRVPFSSRDASSNSTSKSSSVVSVVPSCLSTQS
jgi:hypothetical protein